MKKISLYIHIPFCVKKCGYCDFTSFEYDKDLMKDYLDHLKKEIKFYKTDRPVHTVFFGGGTPSLLTGDQMKELMALIKENFNLDDCIEVSMESNPGTLNVDKLLAYKEAGINRISMGVQTLNNDTLKTLDRIHDVQAVYDSVANLQAVGFDNYNMDLMFGLPGQSLDDLRATVEKMVALRPSHISAYSLKIEEGTDFYKKLEKGELYQVEDELDRQMYHLIEDILSQHGYSQYEISNFSKDGLVCHHNLVYWTKEDYLGIGIGAHGYDDGKRYYNYSDFENYFASIKKSGHAKEEVLDIDYEEDLFEYIMLTLRLNEGFSIQGINDKYQIDFLKLYKTVLDKLLDQGLIEVGSRMTLTSLGRDLSNQVFLAFLD